MKVWIFIAICLVSGAIGLIVVGILYGRRSKSQYNYGIGIDAGSSRTDFYVYRWPTEKLNGTGVVEQIYKCPSASDSKIPGHVANYLVADGEYRQEFGSDWPLTEQQLAILDDNQGILLDLIEMIELLGPLFSREVINKRQRDVIDSERMLHRKNEAFLEILRRKSQKDYMKTILCLQQSKQAHVVQILDTGRVTVRVHVETNQTMEEETEIAEEFARRLGNKSAEERRRILELTQFKIIAAKAGH